MRNEGDEVAPHGVMDERSALDALAESLAEASVPFFNNVGSKADFIHGIDVVLSIAVMLVKNSTSDVTPDDVARMLGGRLRAIVERSFEEHGTPQ